MTTNSTIGDLMRESIRLLRDQPEVESPGLEAQILIGHVLNITRETLIAHPERIVAESDLQKIRSLITDRARGVPIAYLTGQRAFYDRTLAVSDAVLIPRPETELIVTTALAWAKEQHLNRILTIDVGTGSGAIAVTLGAHLPKLIENVQVIGADISVAALQIARQNAIGLHDVHFVQANLLESFYVKADLIAANLPYIPTAEWRTLAVSRYEPRLALDGGADGLDLIRQLLRQAPDRLAQPGLLLIEHAADQGSAVQDLARIAFPAAEINQLRDDAGLDRIVAVYW